MSSHAKTLKYKQKLNVPRHANQINNTNTTEHELKYPEASRSSFLKLELGKFKPIEAMQTITTQTYFTAMVNLKEAEGKWKDPHVTLRFRDYT